MTSSQNMTNALYAAFAGNSDENESRGTVTSNEPHTVSAPIRSTADALWMAFNA